MAYKTPVVSMPGSLKAFDGVSRDVFLCFENYCQLKTCIEKLGTDEIIQTTDICYNYVVKNHSWKFNYGPFVKYLTSIYDNNGNF